MNLLRTMPVTTVSAALGVLALVLLVVPSRLNDWLRRQLFIDPASAEKRIALFDFVRAFAALYVGAYHLVEWTRPYADGVEHALPFVNRGIKAVPMFAALSGFLIYGIAAKLDAMDEVGGYLKRRFLRIFPLYIVTTVAYMIWMEPELLSDWRHWVSNVFMLRCLGYPRVTGPTAWSLYVEEVFYFVCPMVAALLRKRADRLAILLFACFLASACIRWSHREVLLVPFFLVGMAAYEATNRRPLSLAGARACLSIGVGLLATDLFHPGGGALKFCIEWLGDRVGAYGLCAAPLGCSLDLIVGLGFLLAAGTHPQIDRLFRWWPILFCASISYSLYLTQGFVLLFEQGDGAVPLGTYVALKFGALIGMSTVTYLAIERPFLNYRKTGGGLR